MYRLRTLTRLNWRASSTRLPTARMATAAGAQDGPLPPDTQCLLYAEWANTGHFHDLMAARGLDVVYEAEVADWRRVRFAVVWNPPPGLLQRCPELRAVMSLGAGVDGLLKPGVVAVDGPPLLRVVDPLMAQRMATWAVWGVINWQRRFEAYAAAQRARRWDQGIEARANVDSCDVRVGVMGFGVMGRATADALLALGYQVSAWARTPKQHDRVTCYAGAEQLEAFVRGSDALVCLLPLTPDTEGILGARTLAWLPRGGAVISGGRGKHVVEADLLAALVDGRVGFALLDVFDPEPLPPESRLWEHPGVRITPHVAAQTTLENTVDQIVANYQSIAAGDGPLPANVVDRSAGY